MAEATTLDFPLKHMLPYDGLAVAEAIGVEGVVLPQSRCMEDRPEDNRGVMHAHPTLLLSGGPDAIDMAKQGGFELGVWVLAPKLGEVAVSLRGIVLPRVADKPELWTSHAMLENAQRTGLSLPGGLWGVTVARALGMEMTKPGSFLELKQPLDVMAAVISQIAPELGRLHENCKAREAAAAILAFIAEKPDLTLATGLETAPWADQDSFDDLVDAARRLVAGGVVRGAYKPPATQRPLIKDSKDFSKIASHAGEHVIAIDNGRGDNVLWDTASAWAAGEPGYALNVALYKETNSGVHQRLNGFLGTVIIEHTVTALIGYQGATINNLPKRKDGMAPQVLHVAGSTVTPGELR